MTQPFQVSALVALAGSEHPSFAFVDQPWADQALCAQTDPEVFFPESGRADLTAKKVCARCDVQAECLAFALTTKQPHGVWGGLSVKERRPLTHIPCIVSGCTQFFATEINRAHHVRLSHARSTVRVERAS